MLELSESDVADERAVFYRRARVASAERTGAAKLDLAEGDFVQLQGAEDATPLLGRIEAICTERFDDTPQLVVRRVSPTQPAKRRKRTQRRIRRFGAFFSFSVARANAACARSAGRSLCLRTRV